MKRTVAVLYGGASGEHEVSIKSAFNILSNIDYNLFNAKPIFINKENKWFEQGTLQTPPNTESQLVVTHPTSFNPFELTSLVDVVFPITHGPFGEDGRLQSILDYINIPYVGCGVLESAVSMDKGTTKDLFVANNIPQGQYQYFFENDYALSQDSILTDIETQLGYPCFIKPANLGSSVGINKAANRTELLHALEVAFKHDNKVVVEEFIKAREVEIGVLGNGPYTLSSIGEIETSADFYDYDAKYVSTDGNKMLIPTSLPPEVEAEIRIYAEKVAKVINVKGLSRIDFFYSEEAANRVMVNEINTLPGFTKYSMYPMLFGDIGIEYKNLITQLIDLAIENYKSKKLYSQLVTK